MSATMILPGFRVRITSRGRTVEGIVKSAVNYGNEAQEDWYITLNDDAALPTYWKQGQDTGTVEVIGDAT